jgi:DNA-binding MarR family transcriptional regulator/YHS domain-containing protein
MATDPVCGMTVTVTPATPIAQHRSVVYSFCADVCRRRFEKEPRRFLRAGTARGRRPPASAARARQLRRVLRRLARQLADPGNGLGRASLADLAPADWAALIEVGDHHRLMMSRLARACGLPLSTMTGLVGRLESKGYLRRLRIDTDRRVVYVEMTPQGARLYRARLEADMRIVIALLDTLTAREQESVVRALGKVTEALEPSPTAEPMEGASTAEPVDSRRRKAT